MAQRSQYSKVISCSVFCPGKSEHAERIMAVAMTKMIVRILGIFESN